MTITSRIVRHLKRMPMYWVVTDSATVQTRTPLVDGDLVYVYIGEDGQFYVRSQLEMNDGRFENVRHH